MLSFANKKVYLACGHTDMRKSINGLVAIVESSFKLDPFMSGTGRCYDNARMESFFATLKKEKLYKVKTALLPMSTVKSIIFRWIFTYYNR